MSGLKFGHPRSERVVWPLPLPLPRGEKSFFSQGVPGGGVLRCQKWAEQAKNAMLSPFLTLFEIMSDLLSEVRNGGKWKGFGAVFGVFWQK
jgi:hypothetical protein